MKRLVLYLILFFSSVCCFSQEPLSLDTVIVREGQSAQEIYRNVKLSVVDIFKSSKDVIQLDDAEKCHIICKGNIPLKVGNLTWSNLTGVINFTLEIMAKDGRLRMRASEFFHTSYTPGWTEGPVYRGGVNPDIKGLRKMQNKKMHHYALPVIYEYMNMALFNLIDKTEKSTGSFEEDW